jgi:hypothetical protein
VEDLITSHIRRIDWVRTEFQTEHNAQDHAGPTAAPSLPSNRACRTPRWPYDIRACARATRPMPRTLCSGSQSLERTGAYRIASSVGLSSSKGIDAMLAEIFMLRLETAARVLRERLPSSASQFVCYTPNSQFTFKQSGKPSEASREPSATQKVQ